MEDKTKKNIISENFKGRFLEDGTYQVELPDGTIVMTIGKKLNNQEEPDYEFMDNLAEATKETFIDFCKKL